MHIKYLLASEKVLLAYYVAHPAATNKRVFTTLGISAAGLKKLKRGLIDKLVLVSTKGGYTVRLPGLVLLRDEQGGHFVSEKEAEESGHKVAMPAPKMVPVLDILNTWSMQTDHFLRLDSPPSSLLNITEKLMCRLKNESPEGSVRDSLMADMQHYADKCYALSFIWDNASKNDEQKLIDQLRPATREQLASFRKKSEIMLLAGTPPQKLLESIGCLKRADPGTGTVIEA